MDDKGDTDDEADDTETAASSSSFGAGSKSSGDDKSLYRKELAVIHFNTKSRPAPAGVRGCEVCIPNTMNWPNYQAPTDSAQAKSDSSKVSSSIVKHFQRIRSAGKQNELLASKLIVVHERTSQYDPLSSCLVDFKSRANIASIKNFQLVESNPQDKAQSSTPSAPSAPQLARPDNEKDFVLQMGKTTQDCFNMDFKSPISLLQAFAICVARFDAKLSW
jgi:hypothetical protein